MPSRSHSPAFTAIRDLVLALDDADRRPLCRLYGAMQDDQPDPTPALLDVFRAIATLDDADHVRLARWFRRYANRWGGVPSAASHKIVPAPREKPPT